ncbi:type II toxin-antitoxin system CcdA family antitoxin [Streptomyces sp. NPDC091219]|uniref:type II toxin-antitoxin system CcdA family antitoxin n=1 Tax=Streptomyces sp. NPDC091219 TaxID=3155193 RepID=UPI00344D0513
MRMNISVPDSLAEQVRARDLPISAICQKALLDAVERERAKEGLMSDIAAVVERLRGTVDDKDRESRKSDRDMRGEGHADGIAWAKDYATAAELQHMAFYDPARRDGPPLRSLFPFMSDKKNEKVTHIPPIRLKEPYWEGFVAGAGEVWAVVADQLR